VVLIAVAGLTYAFLPQTRWPDTARDLLASGLYAVNWTLADRAVDYLAADTAPSPVQHFWSLAVEEQFYLAWPLLMLIATWRIRRRARRRPHVPKEGSPGLARAVTLALICIMLTSFAASVVLTATDPSRAYFTTHTRVWELALGGLVAVTLPRLTTALSEGRAVALGWSGLIAVFLSAVVLSQATPFPGYAAALPTLGAAAVIAAGPAAGARGPVAVLALRPMQWIGGLSYPLYLWHWPLLVVANAQLDGRLGVAGGLGIAVLSFVPAYLSHRFIEAPVRFSAAFDFRPVRALQLGLICTATGALAGLMLSLAVFYLPTHAGALLSQVQPDTPLHTATPALPPGARILGDPPRGDPAGEPVDEVGSFVPDPLSARGDLPLPDDCLAGFTTEEPIECSYGPAGASTTIVLVGDSHSAQFAAPLRVMAESEGWRLLVYTKGSCPFAAVEVARSGEPYPTCATWNEALQERLAGMPAPALVVTSSSKYVVMDGGQPLDEADSSNRLVAGFREAWRPLLERGVPIVTLNDTPIPSIDVPECVATNPERLTECAVDREVALRVTENVTAARGVAGVHPADLNDAICPGDRCAPIIGGALVYRDTNHLTATYAATLAPRLASIVSPLLAAD
jgi:peptidoglycan/LPS O-acetylase OafA/YrhL